MLQKSDFICYKNARLKDGTSIKRYLIFMNGLNQKTSNSEDEREWITGKFDIIKDDNF